ncbi:MAG: hypothetical protein GY751_06870 [Bacteroidetes bacterium]|nr:hypothetical protein [Bacteroidota bacterium]
MRVIWTVFASLLLSVFVLNAQVIEFSPPQKTIVKYDDYEIVGRNSIGTIVHYYSKGNNHKLQVFNSKMRPLNEVDLDFEEKRMSIEKILLSGDHILVFYSTIENNYEYLKLKKVNYRLDVFKDGTLLDSIQRGAVNNYQGFYIKPSLNDQYYIAFTFEEKDKRMQVNYILMDRYQKVLRKDEIWTEDKKNLSLESVKVNNSGDIMIVIGHENKRIADDETFALDQYTVHYIGMDDSVAVKTTFSEEGYLFKDLLTNWDQSNRNAILIGTYQLIKDDEDVGIFYGSINSTGEQISYTKIPFKEEDFIGGNSHYRKWDDNAEIQRPKRIIPRTDGGFIYITEAERHEYRLMSTSPGGTNPGYPYTPDYNNYFDENYYYGLMAVSIDPDGMIDWRLDLPKIQVTENDRGRYSSFMFYGNNNVTKLLFVDDIYGNGNLTEYNFNPNGQWNKQVLLNSFRDDLLLVPMKGKQLSGTEIIIPSEKKNRLRLVKINY